MRAFVKHSSGGATLEYALIAAALSLALLTAMPTLTGHGQPKSSTAGAPEAVAK